MNIPQSYFAKLKKFVLKYSKQMFNLIKNLQLCYYLSSGARRIVYYITMMWKRCSLNAACLSLSRFYKFRHCFLIIHEPMLRETASLRSCLRLACHLQTTNKTILFVEKVDAVGGCAFNSKYLGGAVVLIQLCCCVHFCLVTLCYYFTNTNSTSRSLTKCSQYI